MIQIHRLTRSDKVDAFPNRSPFYTYCMLSEINETNIS